MNYTNRMVSSDNMGYASYLMEQDKNGGQLPGQVRLGEDVAGPCLLCVFPLQGFLGKDAEPARLTGGNSSMQEGKKNKDKNIFNGQ